MTAMDAKPARPWDAPVMRAVLSRSSLAAFLLTTFFTVGTAHASKDLGADGFLSPDHQVWCNGNAQEVGCVTVPDAAAHGAIVKRSGKIILCPESTAGPAWACFQNFDESAPVLHYGQRVETGPFACASTQRGIVCKVRASGRGFRIDRREVVALP
jgi:hypothetical protein